MNDRSTVNSPFGDLEVENLKVKIVYSSPIREVICKSEEEFFVKNGTTIRELIHLLEEKYKEFNYYLRHVNQELLPIQPYIQILINGVNISHLNGFDTKLGGNSTISMVFFKVASGG